MAKSKQKKLKKEIEPNVKKIRKYIAFVFIFIALLGITLGILYWYGIISS